jgi:tetratricopeptide (TPR) repeat protein
MNRWPRRLLLVFAVACVGCDAANELASIKAFNEGVDCYDAGQYEQAVAAFTRSIERSPGDYEAYVSRGCSYDMLGEVDKALADFDKAVELTRDSKPDLAEVYYNRGATYHQDGKLAEALADYREVLRLDSEVADVHRFVARIQCTSPNPEQRDAEEALRNATIACERDDWEFWMSLDTLAAAYAELGRFNEAVKWVRKALAEAPDEHKAKCQERLALYLAGQPLRETRLDLLD